MKYLYHIAIILLPLLSIAQTETKLLQADIRGRSCAGGIGVCTASPEFSKNSIKNFSVAKFSDHAINLTIRLADLSPEYQSMLFGKTYSTLKEEILVFHQDLDYAFQKELLSELRIDSK